MSRIDLSGFGQIPQTQIAPADSFDPFACSEEEAEVPIESTPAWILSAGYEHQVKPIEPCTMILDSFRGTSSHIKVMMSGGNLASALKKPPQFPPELVNSVLRLANMISTAKDPKSKSEDMKKEMQLVVQECTAVCKRLGYQFSQNLIQEVLNQQKNAKLASAERNSQPQANNPQTSNPFASSSEPAPSKEAPLSHNPMMATYVRKNIPTVEQNANKKPEAADPLSVILENIQPSPTVAPPQIPQQMLFPLGNSVTQQPNILGNLQQQQYMQHFQELQRQFRQFSANPQFMAMYMQQQQLMALQSNNSQYSHLGVTTQPFPMGNQQLPGTTRQVSHQLQPATVQHTYQPQPQPQTSQTAVNPLLHLQSQAPQHSNPSQSLSHNYNSNQSQNSHQPMQILSAQPQQPVSITQLPATAHTVVSSEDIDSSPDEALKEKHYRHYTEMKRSGKSKREIKKSIQDKERMKMINKNLAGGPLKKESSQKTIGLKTSKAEAEDSLMAEIKAPENLLQQPQPIVLEEVEQPPLPHPAISPEEQAARAAEETHKLWMRQHLHPVPIWKRDSSKFVKERFREHMREIERESVAKRRARIETREITLLSTKVRYSHQVEFRDADTKEMREISIHLPFVPDNQQTKMLDELVHAMNKQTQIALETVAGCGRSILLMAATLAWLKAKQERRRHSDSKIFFVVENESEIKFAIKEMESLPYSAKYTILAERDRQCTNKSLRFLQGNYKEIACVNLNKSILSNPAFKSQANGEVKAACACPHLESLHTAGSLPQDRASYLPDLESLWEDQEDERHTTRYTPCAYYHSRAALSAAHIVFIPLSLVGNALGLSGNSMAPPSPSTTYGFLSAKGEKTPQFQLWNPFQQPSSFLSFPPAPQSSSLLTSATIPPSIFSASLFLLLPSTPNTITSPSVNSFQPTAHQSGPKKTLRFEVSPPPANQGANFKPQFQLLPQAAIPARRCYPWNLTPNSTCTSLSNLVLPLHLLQRLGHTPIERVAHNLLIILRTKPQEMAAPQLFDILTMAVAGGIRLRHTDGLPECADDEQNGFEYNLDPSQNGGEAFDHLAPVSTESLFGNVGAMDKLIRLINSAEEMLLEKFNQNDIHTMSEHMEALVTISQWIRWLDKVKDLYFEHTNVSAGEQEMQHFRLIIEQRPDLQMKESIALVLECQTPRIFFKNIKRTNPTSIVISSPSMTPFDDIALEINMPNMTKVKSGVPDSLKNTENIHVAILNTIGKEGPTSSRIKGPELISIISCANPSKDRPVLVLFPTAEQLHDWVSSNIANLTKLQIDTKGCIYIEGTWELPQPSLDDGKKISLEQVAEALSKLDKLAKLANGDTKPQENKQVPQLMPFVNSSVSLNGQGCAVIFAVLGGLVCQHRRRSYNSAVPGVRLIIMAGRIESEDFSNNSPYLIRKQQYIERQNQAKGAKTSYADWIRLSASKTLNETMGLLNRKREMAALVLIGQEYDDDLKNTRAFRPWYRSAYNIYNDTDVLLGPLREFFEGKKIPTSRTTKLKPMDMLEKDMEEKSIRYKPSSRLVKNGDKSESPMFQPSNIRVKRSSPTKEERSVQAPFYQKYNQGEISERSVKKANITQRKFGVFNDKEDKSESNEPFSRLKLNTNEMYEPSKKNNRTGKKKGSLTMNGTPERSNFASSEVFGGAASDLFTALQQDMKNLSLSSSSEHPEASKPMIPVPHDHSKQDKGAKSDFEIIQEKFRLTTSSVGSQKGARKEKSETREDTLEIIDENEAGRTQRLTDYLGKRRLTWDYSPSETSTKGLPQTSPKVAKDSRPNIITVQEVRDPLGIGLPESEDSVNALMPLMLKPVRQESSRQQKHGGDAPLRPRAMFDDSNDSGEASYLKSTKSDTKRYQNSTTSQTGPRDSRRDVLGEQRSHRLTSRNKRPRVEQMEPQEYKSPLSSVPGGGYKGFAKEYHR